MKSDIVKEAKIGDKATITLSSGNEITSEIKYLAQQENDSILVIFDLKTLTNELIQYRKISFNITWWSASGLKVPNTSILEDENGLSYVLIKKSNNNEKAIVKIKKKSDKYSIISNYNSEELTELGIDSKTYNKINKFDTILLYPDKE